MLKNDGHHELDLLPVLRTLADGVRGMGLGDPDCGERIEASDVVRWAVDEIERLRLTDEEREAIRFASALYERGGREDCAATLRSLLERAPRTYFRTAGKRLITNMSGDWIPVSQRLPTIGEQVLVVALGRVITATRREGWWRHEVGTVTKTFSLGCCAPTHWMPLPAPPTDGK